MNRAAASRWQSVPAALLLAVVHRAAAQSPDIRFSTCDACGIEEYHMAAGMGGGVAAADVNHDGFVDLFVPTAAGSAHQFYLNNGDGSFDEVAPAAGLDSTSQGRCALWLDHDGDGDLDLLIANDDPDEPSTYRLYRQDADLVFVDDTVNAGLFIALPAPLQPGDAPHRGGMAAGDLNNDGWLDLVTCLWNGQPEVFFNNQNGGFINATSSSGVSSSVDYPWQPVLFDINRDGLLDIYLAVDFRWNGLFINQGDGTFVDIAPAAHADSAWNDMGVTLGDHDRDGDFDIYITNITSFGTHNVLLQNQTMASTVDFLEVAQTHGVDDGGWGWGCTFFDADNDGWLDLAATNGWDSIFYHDDPSRFFWNQLADEQGEFVDASESVAFDDPLWGSCLISADVDRDGRLDLIQTCNEQPLRVLMNRPAPGRAGLSNEHRWLTVQPRMPGSNHLAIGAEVAIEVTGQLPQVRLITAGTSFLGQEPAEAHFGLADADMIDRMIIRWSDGSNTCITDIAANQVITVSPTDGGPCVLAGDADGDGDVDVADLLTVITNWGSNGPAGDVTNDGAVGLADLLLVVTSWGAAV